MPTQKEMDDYNRQRYPNLDRTPMISPGTGVSKPFISTKPTLPATKIGSGPGTGARISLDPREMNGGLKKPPPRKIAINGRPGGPQFNLQDAARKKIASMRKGG
jgi:hypothetical protein